MSRCLRQICGSNADVFPVCQQEVRLKAINKILCTYSNWLFSFNLNLWTIRIPVFDKVSQILPTRPFETPNIEQSPFRQTGTLTNSSSFLIFTKYWQAKLCWKAGSFSFLLLRRCTCRTSIIQKGESPVCPHLTVH